MLTIPKRKRNPTRAFGAIFAVTLLAGGIYTALTAVSPLWHTPTANGSNKTVAEQLSSTEAPIQDSALYIPKLNVDVPFARGEADVLEHGAWWRTPDSGNPKDGGNFVVAAHRFEMGWTPTETTRKSPFYNIDKLAIDDQIVVDYQGERFTYIVTKIHRVAPDAIEIEAPTKDDRLTLYSCTLGGSSDGREVIIAKQVSIE